MLLRYISLGSNIPPHSVTQLTRTLLIQIFTLFSFKNFQKFSLVSLLWRGHHQACFHQIQWYSLNFLAHCGGEECSARTEILFTYYFFGVSVCFLEALWRHYYFKMAYEKVNISQKTWAPDGVHCYVSCLTLSKSFEPLGEMTPQQKRYVLRCIIAMY